MNDKKEREALFWCSLLQPALYGEIPSGGMEAYLRDLASRPLIFPGGKEKCPSVSTLKRKLKAFKNGGFNKVKRKPRADHGASRAVPQAVVDRAIEVKCDQPFRSPAMINQILEAEYGKTIPPSTLFRHLKKAGATRLKLGAVKKPVRKRWTTERPNDMWVGDVSHGPRVLVNGVASSTRLSAFIDVHSRYIVAARYYLNEKLPSLYDTLLRGFADHGLPRAIYVDNAKIYHASSFKAACFRLQINLLHRKVRDPEGGGLIERFFQTAQNQFESEVQGKALSLDDLNRGFSAWLDVVYHRTSHREIKTSPAERYGANDQSPRRADPAVLAEVFLESEERTVDRTFSDISLYKTLYRVDQKLRGDRVVVRYDPYGTMTEVMIYDDEGCFLGRGVRHERETGEQPLVTSGNSEIDTLAILTAKQQQLRKAVAIDYKAGLTTRSWSIEAFLSSFSSLLGRKGVSDFSQAEMAALTAVYGACPKITRGILKRAFARAATKQIADIAYALQNEEE